MKPKAETYDVGLESWGKIFDQYTYAYLFLCVMLFSLWYVISLTINQFISDCIKSDRVKWNRTIKRGFITFPQIVWNSILALIDEQQIPIPNNFSSKILLSAYLVAIFNLILGFFCNCISVDMVAIQPVPTINSLQQLIYDFKDLRIVTAGGLWQEGALRTSQSGSLERRLADRILPENYIPMFLDISLAAMIADHALPTLSGEEVVVIDRQLIPIGVSFICQAAKHVDTSRIHISHDWFGERLLVPMFSQSSDEKLIKWSRYKSRQLLESFIFQNLVRSLYQRITIDQSASLFEKIICIEGRGKGQENDSPDPFQLIFFLPLIKLYFKIIILSLIILICEILLSFLKQTTENLLK